MRSIYTLLILLAVIPATLFLNHRGRAAGDLKGRWRERYGHVNPISNGLAVWVHAASVGEVNCAIPLINALLLLHGDGQIAITCMTTSGSRQIRQLWGDRIRHSYLPFDLPWLVARFLARWAPRQAVFIETELWPNLYRQLARKKIPVVIANARLSERSTRGYQRVAGLIHETLGSCDCVAAQSDSDAQRFRQLGAPNVVTIGNLKCENETPSSQITEGARLRVQLGTNRPAWIAASTHEGEEALALQAHRRVLEQFPDAMLIIVPRHPQRFESCWQLIEQSGLRCARRQLGSADTQTQVLLGDSMGEMFTYFSAVDVAFVGGSLVPIGGHNVLEPALLGLPVLFGPQMQNFVTAQKLLLESGGGIEVTDATSLADETSRLLSDVSLRTTVGANAQAVVAGSRGALQRLLSILDALPRAADATGSLMPSLLPDAIIDTTSHTKTDGRKPQ